MQGVLASQRVLASAGGHGAEYHEGTRGVVVWFHFPNCSQEKFSFHSRNHHELDRPVGCSSETLNIPAGWKVVS